MDDRRVGVIGLGAMGRPLAKQLIESGYDVYAYDISEDAVGKLAKDGAHPAASPAVVAEEASFVLTMLPHAEDIRQALLGSGGAAEKARAGSVFFDSSTVDPMTAREIGEELASKGIKFLDGGVSGNPEMVRNGTITLMVGGDRAAFDAYRTLFQALCNNGRLLYTGELGSAKLVKLACNMVAGVTMAAVAEAFALGLKGEVEPQVLYEGLMGSWARCFQLEARPPVAGLVANSPVNEDFAPDFSVDYIAKDLSYALRTAQRLGSFMGLGNLAHELYAGVSSQGDGRKDMSIIGRAVALMNSESAINGPI